MEALDLRLHDIYTYEKTIRKEKEEDIWRRKIFFWWRRKRRTLEALQEVLADLKTT